MVQLVGPIVESVGPKKFYWAMWLIVRDPNSSQRMINDVFLLLTLNEILESKDAIWNELRLNIHMNPI